MNQMKRSAFIASILGAVGIGKAQQWTQYADGCKTIFCAERKPALNNQCPVCGTMAEPRKFQSGGMRMKPCDPPSPDPGIVCAEPVLYDPGPDITRCKRCNAAFWQDAEA